MYFLKVKYADSRQGEGGKAWKCWRRLLVWEEELVGECLMVISNIHLQVDVTNRW